MPQILPTAERALQIFEIYARERRPLSNSEMARLLGIADSSCSDLLYTLRQAGYLLRSPKTRLFYATGRLLDVAQQITDADPLQTFAAEALEILSRQSGESSMCAYVDGTQARIFACQESPRALRYVLKPGTLVDMHTSALGKALLGTMDEKSREALLDKMTMTQITDRTIVDKDALRKQFDDGQRNKYYVTRGEGNENVGAIGIAGYVGGQLIAISLVGPTTRMEQNFDANVEILLKARSEFFDR